MSHLFGPVPSRRLGRSLGVDLMPPKTCSFDCLYCEVGPTTVRTLQPRDYQFNGQIIREVEELFRLSRSEPDFITLAGSGEPTLNLGLGRIIAAIKHLTDIPVAVLTNGALLFRPEVRQALMAADVVLPSLDAASEETFQTINRPAPGLTLEMLIEGLRTFRREYPGQMWLEVMLLEGLNDTEAELEGLRRAIQELAPDKVQLNTAVRPVAEDRACPLETRELEAIAAYLGAGVEVIADFRRPRQSPGITGDADYLEMLARRPMTAPDLAQALGVPVERVERDLARLTAAGRISCGFHNSQGFYRSQTHPE